MASSIDPTKPIVGTPTTASVRDNFAAAKAEIEALQAQVASIIATFQTRAIITADFADGVAQNSPAANVLHDRTLNTIIDDGGFLISLTGNAFTLPPGLYRLIGEFQVYRTYRTKTILRDITAAADLDISINEYVHPSYGAATIRLESQVLLTVQSELKYQQIFSQGGQNFGWGISSTINNPERYARVTIQRLPQ